jgi:hypothetical protein
MFCTKIRNIWKKYCDKLDTRRYIDAPLRHRVKRMCSLIHTLLNFHRHWLAAQLSQFYEINKNNYKIYVTFAIIY